MLLRLARGERSFSDWARALETSWLAAKRLGNPAREPSLKTLDRAVVAPGKRLVLSLEQPVAQNARGCDLCQRQRHLMERLFGETTH